MVKVENHTPFPHLAFEKYGPLGQCFDVLVFKMTYKLKADETYAYLSEKQTPLVMADEYYHLANDSSLKFETDLVLHKPRTDIHIIGHACTENLTPKSNWLALIQVGNLSKQLYLRGACNWIYQDNKWQLSEIAKTNQIPLRYENAYGGHWKVADSNHEDIYSFNPLGCGYYPNQQQLDKSQVYRAPQILGVTDLDLASKIDSILTPEGTGPLSRWWPQRLQYAGTYDDNWQKTRYPFLPDDFNYQFYNSSHPELCYERFLQGNESIVIEGFMSEMHRVKTQLPHYKPVCVIQNKQNQSRTLIPFLDTLTIDLDEHLIYATWRLTLARQLEVSSCLLGCFAPPPSKGGGYGR